MQAFTTLLKSKQNDSETNAKNRKTKRKPGVKEIKNDRNAGSKTSNKAIKMGQGQGAPRVSKEEQVFSEAEEDTDSM